jgi:hypothetical protein
MYVCMYVVYMYVCIYVVCSIYVRMYVFTYIVCIQACTYACFMYVCTYLCMSVCQVGNTNGQTGFESWQGQKYPPRACRRSFGLRSFLFGQSVPKLHRSERSADQECHSTDEITNPRFYKTNLTAPWGLLKYRFYFYICCWNGNKHVVVYAEDS